MEALEEFLNRFIQSETSADTHKYCTQKAIVPVRRDKHHGLSPVLEAGLRHQLVHVPTTVMVSALDSGSMSRFKACHGHYVVFLGQTVISLPLCVSWTNKWLQVNCWGNLTKCWRVSFSRLLSHPRGVVFLNLNLLSTGIVDIPINIQFTVWSSAYIT